MKAFNIAVGALAGLFVASTATADMYRCKVDGKYIYTDIPCASSTNLGIEEKPLIENPEETKGLTQARERIDAEVEKIKSRYSKASEQAGTPKPKPRPKRYDIDRRATERNGTVEISGRITGPQCDSLRVDAFARTSDGGIVECTTMTRLNGNSTLYSCTDTTRRAKDGRNRDWFVSSIYANCQE